MQFKKFKKEFQNNFEKITKGVDNLFEVELDKDELWNLYLDSFPEGTNNIYRERREYDCSCCRHFIKTMGAVVVIKNNKLYTLWDFDTKSDIFQPVVNALNDYVKSKPIKNIFIPLSRSYGTDSNIEIINDGASSIVWEHFYLEIPENIEVTNDIALANVELNDYKTNKEVFKRSLEEISYEALDDVLGLIKDNTLYKGLEWQTCLSFFIDLKRKYDSLDETSKELFLWKTITKYNGSVTKLKNHSIGVLLIDLTQGKPLEESVRKYEQIVAPENYRRSKPIFTKKMLEDAKKTIEGLGLLESLNRRHATLDDISVNNILFCNRDAKKRIKGANVFDEMLEEITIDPNSFNVNKVEEITIEGFINSVLPTAKEISCLLENRHVKNMVSLIAPQNTDSKNMFKWNNAFSWAYSGNITDSTLKENVKAAGGKVDGVLRFSIQWNDEEYDGNDLDAHCIEPNGFEIYYGDKIDHKTGGNLDIDIINPSLNVAAVENITWPSLNAMEEGEYIFLVHNFTNRGGRNGFKAEIEFGDELYSFEYRKELKQDEKVIVAKVYYSKDEGFTIKELIPSNTTNKVSKDVWNVKTNTFIPVSTIMYSPNYWDEQQGIGHKHYFFMLKDCVNPESPNGFYNEFLKEDLLKHRKVLEALGNRMKVATVEDQLSGVGFSSTKRNDLIVKVVSNKEKIYKIIF